MRTPAKVDQRPAPVHSGSLRLHLLLQDPQLELVVFEHLEQVRLLHLQPLEGLLLLDDALDQIVDNLEVVLLDMVVRAVHVLVEAGLDGRPVEEVAAVDPLHGLAEHVGRAVPEDVLALLVIELYQLQPGRGLQGSVQVPHLTVHLEEEEEEEKEEEEEEEEVKDEELSTSSTTATPATPTTPVTSVAPPPTTSTEKRKSSLSGFLQSMRGFLGSKKEEGQGEGEGQGQEAGEEKGMGEEEEEEERQGEERERERETKRKRERETKRKRERETKRKTKRQREKDRNMALR